MWKQLMTSGLLSATLLALSAETLADHRQDPGNRDHRDNWEQRDDRRHWNHRNSRQQWNWRQQQRQQWRWRNQNRYYWNGRWYNSPRGNVNRGHIGWGPRYFGGVR
jgi:hypothetical protein